MASFASRFFLVVCLCSIHLSTTRGESVVAEDLRVYDKTGVEAKSHDVESPNAAAEEREAELIKRKSSQASGRISGTGLSGSSTTGKVLRTSGVLLVTLLLVKLANAVMSCFARDGESKEAGSTRRSLSTLWGTDDLCDIIGGKAEVSPASEVFPFNIEGDLSVLSLKPNKLAIGLAVVALVVALAVSSAEAMPQSLDLPASEGTDNADGSEEASSAGRSKRSVVPTVHANVRVVCDTPRRECTFRFRDAVDNPITAGRDPKAKLLLPFRYVGALDSGFVRSPEFLGFRRRAVNMVRQFVRSRTQETTTTIEIPLPAGVSRSIF